MQQSRRRRRWRRWRLNVTRNKLTRRRCVLADRTTDRPTDRSIVVRRVAALYGRFFERGDKSLVTHHRREGSAEGREAAKRESSKALQCNNMLQGHRASGRRARERECERHCGGLLRVACCTDCAAAAAAADGEIDELKDDDFAAAAAAALPFFLLPLPVSITTPEQQKESREREGGAQATLAAAAAEQPELVGTKLHEMARAQPSPPPL